LEAEKELFFGYGTLVLPAPATTWKRAAIAGTFDPEEVVMATNPVHASELNLTIERTSAEIIVHCSGRITADTIQP